MSLPTKVVRTSLLKTGLLFVTGIAIVAALAGIPVEGGRILSLPWAIALVAMLTLICGMNALRPNKVTLYSRLLRGSGRLGNAGQDALARHRDDRDLAKSCAQIVPEARRMEAVSRP